jgi:hypothetical protein
MEECAERISRVPRFYLEDRLDGSSVRPDDPTSKANLDILTRTTPKTARIQRKVDPRGLYVFGQFIDHDLTFDRASSLQKQNDHDALQDFRTLPERSARSNPAAACPQD